MKNFSEINLLSAVIEFTKDPDKYSQYLTELRAEVSRYEDELKKFSDFTNAQAFIDSEKVKLNDLRQLLEETRDALDKAWKEVEINKDSVQKSKEQQLAELARDRKQLEIERNSISKDLTHNQEVRNANDDNTRRLAQWQNSLNDRESKFNHKWSLLQAVMNENN